MLQTLEHRARLVALEAHLISDVANLVRGVAHDVSEAFGDFVAHIKPTLPGITVASNNTPFLREIVKHNYMALRPLQCFTPEGLKVTYLEYLEALAPAVEHAAAVGSNVLNPYASFLADMVTNRDGALRSKDFSASYAALGAKRELLQAQLGKCFSKGGHESSAELGKVVARMNDWQPVLAGVDACAVAINKVDRKALDKKMHECVELLDILQKKLERNEYGDVSPEVANNLASGAFQAAKELEFFSTTYYRVLTLAEAVQKTTEQLLRVVTDKA